MSELNSVVYIYVLYVNALYLLYVLYVSCESLCILTLYADLVLTTRNIFLDLIYGGVLQSCLSVVIIWIWMNFSTALVNNILLMLPTN